MSNPLPTSIDVARLAGVSQATVSRALRQSSSVSPETRERILKAAQQLGYRPNSLARGLRGGSTHTIGLIWPIGLRWGHDLVHPELARRCEQRHHVVLPIQATDASVGTVTALDELLARNADALVMRVNRWIGGTDAIREKIERFPAVVVVVDEPIAQFNVPQIHLSNHQAMHDLAMHWRATGRRRIAAIGNVIANQAKLAAFKHAIAQQGLSLIDQGIIDATLRDPSTVVQHITRALDAKYPGSIDFDAIFCTNDEVAAATCHWLGSRGVKVPDDVAVAGFDNASWCACFTPPLASVDRQDMAIASAIEQMLFFQMDSPGEHCPNQAISRRFIWRSSAGGQAPAAQLSHSTDSCISNVQESNP